nr:carbohydrate kinase family protein [Comamonas jiangduensis]
MQHIADDSAHPRQCVGRNRKAVAMLQAQRGCCLVIVGMSLSGDEGASYIGRKTRQGIDTRFVKQLDDSYTAQAMIMTDSDNNQITAFHPGAMTEAHVNMIDGSEGASVGIVSPDGRDAMLQHSAQFKAAGIPFVFDPGQGLPMFNGQELLAFVEQATWIAVNDYEAKMLCDRTGLDLAALSMKVQGLVVTLGEQGCQVWEQGQMTLVAPVKAQEVVDPTGCGDAWRGALLYGLEKGWPLAKCAALGNRVGALKVAAKGPQNYVLDFDPATFEV